MTKYSNSIKCKYCCHFEPGANHCHLYHDYDQSLSNNNYDSYYKDTFPDSRCAHFKLPAADVITRTYMGKRADGSAIVELRDDPELEEFLNYRPKSYLELLNEKAKNWGCTSWMVFSLIICTIVACIFGIPPFELMIEMAIPLGAASYFLGKRK